MSLNAIHCYGIFTDDYDKGMSVINHLIATHPSKVSHHHFYNKLRSRKAVIYFEDGLRVMWLSPLTTNIRGYRFHKIWTDINPCLLNNWGPSAFMYMTKDDVVRI